jgi:methionine sulfoxide reductase heme-binding subunit
VRIPDGTGKLTLSGLIDNRAVPLLLALLTGLLAIGLGVAAGGDAAEQANLAARWTARAAFPFFLIAYSASSLLRQWPGGLTRALMRRRRQWGLAFALAHTIHLAALATNLLAFDVERPLLVLAGGGLAYGLIYLMALTSNDWSMRKLGRKWKLLHRIGIHYTWLIFFQSYAGGIFNSDPDKALTGLLFTPLLLAALGLRLWLHHGRRRAMAI